ncbi:hypothetical protein A4H97_20615 [Niastella yeongjuensis]|uniref:Outer membrane protein beta-barrel domain-containing protein n=1 Tax=Niastella yeongjuensis TaxID=354355 RepID=A0A1V9FCH3_9BACT|nr:porin family protein [Niastella yeongjuensis]OQP55991.1 hypothetical protein A4H97_20615 [Niastella yeongjuensis]SEP25568.1 Outer membrane protein beta-barrel domain-containing protein [Niastella yeongjuensis]
MKSKLLSIVLATTVFAFGAKAQNTTFGVRAGFGLQNLTGKDANDNKLDNKIKGTINIGLNAEIPFATDFYIQPGLLFATKGAKDKTFRKVNYRLSYLEIPINLLFKPELGDGKLLLGFGPYLGIAVGGSFTDGAGNKFQYKFAHKVTKAESLSAFYTRRTDMGFNFLAGYELSSKLSFQLNAQLGLKNISTKVEGEPNSKVNNTGFGVSVGYRFN